eukprot:COSAG05_NODE_2399_length_3111_cov_58.711819_2_plen_53_part_00
MEFCGHWEDVEPPSTAVGSNILELGLRPEQEVVMVVRMWAADLYSTQFLCGG